MRSQAFLADMGERRSLLGLSGSNSLGVAWNTWLRRLKEADSGFQNGWITDLSLGVYCKVFFYVSIRFRSPLLAASMMCITIWVWSQVFIDVSIFRLFNSTNEKSPPVGALGNPRETKIKTNKQTKKNK